MTNESQARYTGIAKFLHWVIAVIIIMLLIFGQGFEGQTNEELGFSLTAHSSLGLTVLGLIVLRVLWRLGHRPPELPESVSSSQRIAARTSHLLLYALMFVVPLTGLYTAAAHELPIMAYGSFDLRDTLSALGGSDFDFRRSLHEIATWLLIALLAVHIVAAFVHQFVQKDGVLRRMLPGKPKQSV